MTETKRFTITQDFEEHYKQIRDNGHIIIGCFVEQQAEVIVNLLNNQHEQIERLKGNFRALEEVKCELAEENKELRMVIDVLKQQNQKLKGRLNDLGVEYYD
jgi:hypothetical protein